MRGGGRMRRWRSRLGGLALLAALAMPGGGTRGQELPVSLIADQVTYDRETRLLTASGNVEVLHQGRVLRAERIVYDEAADQIRAEGPLVLTDPAGGVLIAERAELTADLTEGLISSARLLIAGKMQMAAVEVRRGGGGRYDTLYNTIASSCTICAENPTPTWALRASRITMDELEERIYLRNARLELFGLPVALLPRLSIPAPGVERASGFLEPRFLQSDIYGFGIKTPYYRVLGPSADVTLTPFLTTGGAALMEGEYRQRFANGGFDFWGVFALDDGLEDGGGFGRGAFMTTGYFGLPRGFEADFDLSAASDDSFLTQFDYTDTDQLTSFARIRRTRAEEYIELGTIAFQSLTDVNESVDVPFVLPQFSYRRLRGAPGVDGRLGLELNSLGILRETGSNSFRAGGQLDWQRDVMLPHGILASGTAQGLVDFYQVWDNPTIADGLEIQAAPTLAGELRWPLVRHTGAADHVIEPIAQVVYVRALEDQNEIPNEDSQLPEFDETNLFAFNRFPGLDRLETGLRANLGVSYTRQDPAGWSMGVTLGRILRADQLDEFTEGTGLDGRWSDYVGAVSLDFAWGLTMVNRALFDPGEGVRRNEFALAYDGDFGALRAAYVYLAENDSDPVLGPQPEINEVSLDARYRVRRNWELRGLWRYDVAAGSNLRAGAGITYGNECAEFDLSVSRRYTSSDNVPPSTSIGFSLRLAGIGEKGQEDWPARVCMRGT